MTTPLHLSPAADETNNVARVMYNGFRFPFARKTSASFTPEMSADGRATKYLRLDLHVEFVWVPLGAVYDPTGHITNWGYDQTATTDATFPNLRRRLTSPGQPLRFIDQGLGTISVQDGTNFDVNNGPKPKVVSATPIAGSRALNVVWECSTWIPNCLSLSNNGQNGITEFTYSVAFSIDASGLTTTSISGSAEIALSRNPNANSFQAGNATRDTADSIRDDILKFFPRQLGFNRTQNFSLSEDRKSLRFTINDQEIPSDNPFFPGIVSQKVTRRYASSIKEGFTKWQGSVSGSIEVAPGFSKLRAWTAFASIFEDVFSKRTLGHLPKTAQTLIKSDTGSVLGVKKSFGLITSISIDEDIYGRSFSFSIGYMLMCSLKELFAATGLFQPLTIPKNEASWTKWRTSLNTIQTARGWRQFGFNPNLDVIVDLCAQPTIPNSKDYQIPNGELTQKTTGDSPNGPSKEESYLHASSELVGHVESGSGFAQPLQQGSAQKESTDINKPNSTTNPNLNQNDKVNNSSTTPVKVSVRQIRPNTYRIVYSGKLIRAGFPPPIPNLASVGGVKALKVGVDQIVQKVLGVGTDVDSGQPLTLYGLSWRKEYVLESPPLDGSIDADGHVGMYS